MKNEMLLESYRETARRAFAWISFTPEKRGEQTIKDYSEELENDLRSLGDNQGNYKEKYIRYFKGWINSLSRCSSPMITGSSNYPVRRAEKARNAEENNWRAWRKWREKYFKAVNRERTLSPEEDLDAKLLKLEKLTHMQAQIKEWNKIFRRYKKGKIDVDELKKQLIEADFDMEKQAKDLEFVLQYDYTNAIYFSLNGKIRQTREMIEAFRARIERKAVWEDIAFDGGYITIEDDRLKIFHDEKPCADVISNLKSRGFRWSRHWGCWSRKHTCNAIYDAKKVCGIEL